MADGLPLPTLLSQVLVAFTIEFDNEFEHRMPHRTATSGPPAGSRVPPWLTSLVMWSNFMRVVRDEGVTVRELKRLVRIPKPSFAGMQRWSYVVMKPDPTIVRPTSAGRRAQEIWRPLFGVIEERWNARFGEGEIRQLRESLWALVSQFDVELPEYLPVVGYGLFTQALPQERAAPPVRNELHLPALLSKVLLLFTIEFERDSGLSLAIAANVVRLLNKEGMKVRDPVCRAYRRKRSPCH